MPPIHCSGSTGVARAGAASALSRQVEYPLTLDANTACLLETVTARWVYCTTLYNNALEAYRALDTMPNFEQLKEGIDRVLKTLEDILMRLYKLEYCEDHIWVD